MNYSSCGRMNHLMLGALLALSLGFGTSLSSVVLARTAADTCGLRAKGAHFLDGSSVRTENVFVHTRGFTLHMWVQTKVLSGSRGIDQWSLEGLSQPWSGLVYVYRHGNSYHACGTGTAVTTWQTAHAGHRHFVINEQVSPSHTSASLRLGKRTFEFSGSTRKVTR